MIIRQLKEKQYENLYNTLIMKAQAEAPKASYTVNMAIHGAECAVKVQPQQCSKMAVLQALRIYREECGPSVELITKGSVLSSFLEILIDQGAGQ